MAPLRRLLRRGCRRQLVPCYLVVWLWLLYCITILEWRKLLNVEIFGVEVRDAEPFAVSVHLWYACGRHRQLQPRLIRLAPPASATASCCSASWC